MTIAQFSDEAMAALSLVDAHNSGDSGATRELLETCTCSELVRGLITVVISLRLSLAAVSDSTPDEISEHLRALLLQGE